MTEAFPNQSLTDVIDSPGASRDETAPRPKRRAKAACLACRSRKVRCDVAQIGEPCTNCSLDGKECTVCERRKRRSRKFYSATVPQQPLGSRNRQLDTISDSSTTSLREVDGQSTHLVPANGQTNPIQGSFNLDGVHGIPSEMQLNEVNLLPASHTAQNPEDTSNGVRFGQNFRLDNILLDHSENPAQRPLSDPISWPDLERQESGSVGPVFNPHTFSDISWNFPDTQIQLDQALSGANYVSPVFSHNELGSWQTVPKPSDLNEIPDEDVQFMKAKGCLQVPCDSLFREFISTYYQYVHPIVPIISESDFWDSFPNGEAEALQTNEFSLLVLQAMLFAASAYISEDVLTSCGFKTFRLGRDSLYQRAKLLFDFEVEKNSLHRGCAAVLLTYQAPNSNENRVNTNMLMNAISFAKIAGAHQYNDPNIGSAVERNRLKRLWWCCIVRDRILPMGVRRPIQILTTQLGSSAEDNMTLSDFDNEIGKSRCLPETTQRKLFQLFVSLCDLSKRLTTVLPLIYQTEKGDKNKVLSHEDASNQIASLKRAEAELGEWFETAALQFPPPFFLDNEEHSVVLFANVLHIFYQGALLSIFNSHAMLLSMQPPLGGLRSSLKASDLPNKISGVVFQTSSRLQEIVQAKLAKYLPLSVCAYLALPMILLMFSVKSSPSKLKFALRRRSFEVYTETINTQRMLFNGTDFVVDLVEELANVLVDHSPTFVPGTSEAPDRVDAEPQNNFSTTDKWPISAWEDLLIAHPILYLRLVMQLDLSFTTGHRPNEAQFPPQLQLTRLAV